VAGAAGAAAGDEEVPDDEDVDSTAAGAGGAEAGLPRSAELRPLVRVDTGAGVDGRTDSLGGAALRLGRVLVRLESTSGVRFVSRPVLPLGTGSTLRTGAVCTLTGVGAGVVPVLREGAGLAFAAGTTRGDAWRVPTGLPTSAGVALGALRAGAATPPSRPALGIDCDPFLIRDPSSCPAAGT